MALAGMRASPVRQAARTAFGAGRWRALVAVPEWATVDPEAPTLSSTSEPYLIKNRVRGAWTATRSSEDIIDPMTGAVMLRVAATAPDEIAPFVASLRECPKSGLHNVFKSPERYLTYGLVSAKAAAAMREPEVEAFFARLIQRVAPKSYAQALGEVTVTRRFLENFSGDQVRFLARSFGVPGDHAGQISTGHRWPYGPVAIISPFNFPLEIPILQLMGSLYMGNKPVAKSATKVGVVLEQYLRLLDHCGAPAEDVDLINCNGATMNELLLQAKPRMTMFCGSSRTAEKLCRDLNGRVKLEDAGFDWKILGPDVGDLEYVAYVCDQDAYAASGQKCSAQSILFAHSHWVRAGLFEQLGSLAARRSLDNLTVGPVLTWTTEAFLAHKARLLEIPGARVLFGGNPLTGHSIPSCYGAWEPTAIFVPLEQLISDAHFAACTTEVFGPFQVVTEYDDGSVGRVLEACERMDHHLTAAVVSNDVAFQNKVLGSTVNGTTYVGRRARTTGAPQNHWFGPAGDPRGAGIGTSEAIRLVWSCHREVIRDEATLPQGWAAPPPS